MIQMMPSRPCLRMVLVVAVVAASLALAGCGSQAPKPSGSGSIAGPTASAGVVSGTQAPGGGDPAPVTAAPPSAAPDPALPAPALTDPEKIADALDAPRTRLQGVVSLLDQLGIGIYAADGSPIRPGAERSITDPWLYASEAAALVDMAAMESYTDGIDFRDWHAGLRELGLTMRAEDLAAALEQTYAEDRPDTFLARLLFATGIDLSADGRLTRLQAWLLLLDGFVVRPAPTAGVRTAMLGGPLIAADDEERWGGGSTNLPALPLLPGSTLTPEQWLALVARIEPMARAVRFELSPGLARAHEGHGADGTPVDMTLWFVPVPSVAPPPLPGEPFLIPQPMLEGLPVTWSATPAAAIERHGTVTSSRGGDPFAGAPQLTDVTGRIEVRFVPQREEADGQGEVATDVAQVTATADVREIARRTWLLPDVVLGMLNGTRQATAQLEVEWHEVDGLRIDLTDDYDVTIDLLLGKGRAIGTDHFTGFLAKQEDGSYRGIVRGTVDAMWRFESPGHDCSTPISGSQDLLVEVEVSQFTREGRDHSVRFYPASGPDIGELGCDITLNRWSGSGPDVPPERRTPSGEFAPFNDTRVTDPSIGGLLIHVPGVGRETQTVVERVDGIGGGTWTLTVERVRVLPR